MKLYPHQIKGFREALNEPFFALFMEQGTGKTPVAIKLIEERYIKGLISKVAIYVPNTIVYNWKLEIGKFLRLRKSQYIIETLTHKKKEQRLFSYKKFLKSEGKLKILLVNYEKARVMTKELEKYKPEFAIMDESHRLKAKSTQVSKNIHKLTKKCRYRLLMTGTPICNGYEDLFMQFKILNEDLLGTNYKNFESRYMVKGGYMNYKIVGYRNEDELKEIIEENSFRVKIEDCMKLPKLINKYLFCDLNPKTQKLYKEMKTEMLTQIERLSGELSRKELKGLCKVHGIDYSFKESYISLLLKVQPFINTASCGLVITQMIRLQQLTGGFITLDSGEIIQVNSDKLKVVEEVTGESKRPVIVFCQYIPEIDLLTSKLSLLSRNKKPLIVKSYRNPKERDEIYRNFHEGEIDVLILQLRSGSVGLNLQLADKVVFYSWNFNSSDYVQAISRIKRHGQLNRMQVIHIIANDTIDVDILEAIKYKRQLADELLD